MRRLLVPPMASVHCGAAPNCRLSRPLLAILRSQHAPVKTGKLRVDTRPVLPFLWRRSTRKSLASNMASMSVSLNAEPALSVNLARYSLS